jgi:hypothetical protein
MKRASLPLPLPLLRCIVGTKRKWRDVRPESVIEGKADLTIATADFRFGPRTEVEPSLIATGYPRAASNEYLLADLEAHQVLADHERPGIGVARFGDQIFDRRCGHVLARQ